MCDVCWVVPAVSLLPEPSVLDNVINLCHRRFIFSFVVFLFLFFFFYTLEGNLQMWHTDTREHCTRNSMFIYTYGASVWCVHTLLNQFCDRSATERIVIDDNISVLCAHDQTKKAVTVFIAKYAIGATKTDVDFECFCYRIFSASRIEVKSVYTARMWVLNWDRVNQKRSSASITDPNCSAAAFKSEMKKTEKRGHKFIEIALASNAAWHQSRRIHPNVWSSTNTKLKIQNEKRLNQLAVDWP